MLINLRNALMTGKRLPYDAEVEYLRVDAVGPYIVIDGVTYCNAVGTYYAFTISSGGVVTHDLIPVRLGNTGYMYDRITNKRFGNAGTGDFVLGQDVVPVEYIESLNSTTYIDLGVYGNQNINTEFAFQLVAANPSCGLFGVYGNSMKYHLYTSGQNPSNFQVGMGNTFVQTTVRADTSKHKILYDDRKVYIDDNLVNTFSQVAGDTPYTLQLFRLLNSRGAAYVSTAMKCFYLNMARGGTDILKLVPIRVGTDATSWEGAMMDAITRRIYRNAGTGAFTYGNDLKYPIPAS